MAMPGSRKRAAPGASPSPAIPPQQMQQQYVPADQMLQWNTAATNGNGYTDASGAPLNHYMVAPQAQQGQVVQQQQQPSNAIARRQNNRALVPTVPRPTVEAWSTFPDEASRAPASSEPLDDEDNIEALEEKAKRVEKESRAKRKQIAPFVQKLSSYLNENSDNASRDLIRWSDKGDSFIVLDEDAFATNLIPVLFKHSNYASFVRQLNMYGFHKRVGLSDNSMRSSERKRKTPSEYSNPYFRRGHPNLLWLISKPKNGSKKRAARKEEEEADSDDDNCVEDVVTQNYSTPKGQTGRSLVLNESGPLQRRDLAQFRDELSSLSNRQQQIASLLREVQANQANLARQAAVFQQQHNRHENSITAILNFLGNVFRKSLEEQGGNQSVAELLASILPHGSPKPGMASGNVQDLGDVYQQQPAATTSKSPLNRKTQHLLPGIPVQNQPRTVPVASRTSSASPAPFSGNPYQQGSRITELFDTPPPDTASPNYQNQEPHVDTHDKVMKFINDTNARSTPGGIDLQEVAANTPATMSTDQRNRMMDSMARGTASSSNVRPASTYSTPTSSSMPAAAPMPAITQPSASAVSPVLANAIPFSAQDLAPADLALTDIQQANQEVSNGIQNITSSFPLSPIANDDVFQGSTSFNDADIDDLFDISGIDGGDTDYASPYYDINTPNFTNSGTTDFDFSLDPVTEFSGQNGLGVLDEAAVKSSDTPSPAGTEEIQRTDLDNMELPSAKRRRL